jgi:hypothetical protein
MTESIELTTAAGRALLTRPLIHTTYCVVKDGGKCWCGVPEAALAIEAEARATAEAQVAELRTKATALLDGLQGIVQGDEHGNPVCLVCGAYLDAEYAHRQGYPCDDLDAILTATKETE